MLSELLKKHNFRFNKQFGQNFLTDTNLLRAVAADSGVTQDSLVLEIGAGAGTLTKILAEKVKYVVSFEIDKTLRPVLEEYLSGVENARLIFSDFLKFEEAALCGLFAAGDAPCPPVDVVANLPYYITTPVLFKLLESALPLRSVTVMLQKEVAERLTANPGGKNYGVLGVMVQYRADVRITRAVGRKLFTPAPEVDSAVVRIQPNPLKPKANNEQIFFRLVRAAFAMRRKTLCNNVIAGLSLDRPQAEELLVKAGVPLAVRGEELSVADFIRLSNLL